MSDLTLIKSVQALTRLVNDLEEYSRTAEEYFTPELLSLLSRDLNWNNLGVTAYQGDEFLGCFASNRARALVEQYRKGFYQRDVVLAYINRNYSAPVKEGLSLVKTTDVFPGNSYEQSDYYTNFMKRVGLKYVTTLVFPRYGLGLYKEDGEGDFSDQELDLIECVYRILAGSYAGFLQHQKLLLTSSVKNRYYNDRNIDFAVFDDQGRTLEYSANAPGLVGRLFGGRALRQALLQVLEFFQVRSNPDGRCALKVFQGYTLTLSTESRVGSFGLIQRYYCLTLSPAQGMDSFSGEEMERFGNLSARELEVLSAFCDGLDYQQVAQKLYISTSTVRTHLKNIYRKLGVDNQRTLIRMYSQYAMNQSRLF